MEMTYNRLGSSGLEVSALSFGSWVTFKGQVDKDAAANMLQTARDAGINFFDNAEAYAGGESERIMGEAITDLGWPRWSYLVSTKLFWGIHDDVNMKNTLNRKYLRSAIDESLERFGLDYVDLVFCHRADPRTPIEGDGAGHERHGRVRQGAVLGDLGVDRRRDPEPPGGSPSASGCTSR